MGRVLSFEDHAVARLRDRLGVAETARADLLAFARGHSAAVAAIHGAVLHALAAESVEALLHSVANDWPGLLEVDSAVVALIVGKRGFRVAEDGVGLLDPALIDRTARLDGAVMRGVERGHALFGRQAADIRAEALVAIGGPGPSPRGVLLLGQRSAIDPGSAHGSELLDFLGQSLAAMMRRWLTPPMPMPPLAMPTPTPRAL